METQNAHPRLFQGKVVVILGEIHDKELESRFAKCNASFFIFN